MSPVNLFDLQAVAARLKYDIPKEHKSDYQKLVGQLRDAAEEVMKHEGRYIHVS